VEDARPTEAVDDPAQRRDLILLEQAREGRLDAFNGLVELYQDHLYALVARMVPDRDQASDAVQEAFFSAYRNLKSFRGGSVRSWLSRIAPEQRSAIVLYDVEGYDYAEIAEMTGVSLGTVKSRIHRGREKLRLLLAAQAELLQRPRRLEE
jgi:DNA-directed RNA polymerase specialized sigma24 family protein